MKIGSLGLSFRAGLRSGGSSLDCSKRPGISRGHSVVFVGASSVTQLEENLTDDRLDFTDDELEELDRYATEILINIWAASREA